MGNLCIRDQRSPESIQIDTELNKQKNNEKSHFRVILLGISGSGKSTICKHLKLIYGSSLTPEELLNYKHVIFANILCGIKSLVQVAEKEDKIFSKKNKYSAECIKALNPFNTDRVLFENKEHVKAMWNDPAIREIWESRGTFTVDFPPNLDYFVKSLDSVVEPDYLPSKDDIIRARQRTTGIAEYNYQVARTTWTLLDVGGQKTERRKWFHFFSSVNALLFVISLEDYDIPCPWDPTKTKMQDSLELWEEMSNLPIFDGLCKIVLLNKTDIFQKKISSSPLGKIFSNFESDSHNYELSLAFVKNLYSSKVHVKKTATPFTKVFFHPTCALDELGLKFVWEALAQNILQKQIELIT